MKEYVSPKYDAKKEKQLGDSQLFHRIATDRKYPPSFAFIMTVPHTMHINTGGDLL